jgi:hypothetical protein
MMSIGASIASTVDQIRRGVDSNYENRFNDEKQTCRTIGMISVAGIVAGVALDILGAGLVVCEGIAAVVGACLIFASLPCEYLGVNFRVISKNMLEIFNNHSVYRTLGVGYFDRQRVQARLGRGSVLCNWAVDMFTNCFVNGTA